MPSISADLAWVLTARNNKYYQKRGQIRMSNDPFNNTGKATKRHAGYIQEKAAVVRVTKNKDITVVTKDGSNLNKPVKVWAKKNTGAKASDAAKAVAAVRPDLADVAFRRAAKLQKTIKRRAAVIAKRKADLKDRTHKRTATRTSKKAKKN